MQRRRFLSLAGTTGALVAAGCITSGAPDDESNDPATPIDDPTSPTPGDTPTPTPDETPTPDPAGSVDGVEAVETSTVGTECASEDGSVDVTFDQDEKRVRLDGALRAPDPCHEAAILDLSLTESDDADRPRLSVDLGSQVPADASDEMCAQCVGLVRYVATITFETDLPGSVAVSHDGEGVGTAAWDSASGGVRPPEESDD